MLKYWYIFKLHLKDTLYYKSKIFANTLTLSFRVAILGLLYSYTYQVKGGELNGIDYQITIWGIAFYFIVLSMNLRRVAQLIKVDVVTGNIELLSNKPYNYLFYKMLEQFAKGLPNIVFTSIIFIAMLLLFVGKPAVINHSIWSIYFFIILVGCVILAFTAYSMVGTAAFWLQDSDTLYWIYDKAVIILGGAYIPVALFPDTVQKISEYSPMGAMMFVSQASNPTFLDNAERLIITQIFWIIFSSILLVIFFNFAKKKLEVNGG